MKSFKATDGSEDDKPNFKGTKRSNKTHASTTDADAKLFRKGKGQESMLCFHGHILVDGASGFIRDLRLTIASGRSEVESALDMAGQILKPKGLILVGDRLYDQDRFVSGTKELGLAPHPRAKSKHSRVSEKTKESEPYKDSMKCRYIVEGSFGWMKQIGNMRQPKFRGRAKVEWSFVMNALARNLVLLAKCA